MPDIAPERPLAPGLGWRCQLAWVLLLLSVLNWHDNTSPFALSLAQERAATVLVTAAAFVLAIQANPALRVAWVLSQVLAGLLVAASIVPGLLAIAPSHSLFQSARFALVVLTIWLLSPIIVANPLAVLRTHLWAQAAITLCVLAGGVLAPGTAFLPGTGRLTGLLPPIHPTQAGAIAAVTLGLSLLALATGTIRRGPGLLALVIAITVLVQSRSRTAALAALLGLLIALGSLAQQNPRVRRLLIMLVCASAMAWIAAAPTIVSWFARGQTYAELGGFSGRREVWIAMLEERPAGLTDWLGVGLGDKRYKGRPIDGGWIAAYWEQGIVGMSVTALLVLASVWQAVRSRHGLLRAVALYLAIFVAVSANTETGISDTSSYFLSLVLAGLLAVIPPSVTQGNQHADRRRAQPLPLGLPQRREPGGGPGDSTAAGCRA